MRRTLTPTQQAATDERKAQRAEMIRAIAAMSDTQRAALASRVLVVNTEGHTLSAKNQMYIAYQRAGCTIVTGFQQWIKAGRIVRKGEHGMTIFVPCNAAKSEDQPEGDIYFTTGTVFDISQTDELTPKGS